MLDADEISPLASWDDDRIIQWARGRGLNRYPIAYVGLLTADPNGADTARIHFATRHVERFRHTMGE